MLRFFLFTLSLVLALTLAPPLHAAGEDQSVNEFTISHVTDADYWSPLPFNLVKIYFPKFSIGSYQFQNGLHATMLLLAAGFLLLFFGLLYKKTPHRAPRGLTNLLEVLVLFVRDGICTEHLGKKDGRRFAPLFLTLFFFILFLNLMGLIPLFTTATGNVNVTAGFAVITFSLMLIGGFSRNGFVGFFKIFIPSGVPFWLVPLLFPIELAGLLIKPFALTIRLFANMLAGHIIIFSIVGLVITYGVYGLPSVALGVFIYLLEFLVAFIQAYIFTLLSAIFVGEMLHPNH